MNAIPTKIIEFDLVNHQFKDITIEELNVDKNPDRIYWIHCNLNEKTDFAHIIKKINLPDEVIKLCELTDSMPKLIDNDESLTIQIECLLSTELPETNEINFGDLVIYLTDRFCFTATSDPLPVISEFIKTYQRSIRHAKTSCFILFLLFDNTITEYARVLFNFELITEKLDVDIRAEHVDMYKEVMSVKQQIMKVKRYTIASREILMRASGRNISVVSEQCRASLYNLSNHSHMVVHEADSIRDMLNGLLDEIENGLIQRMSESMRVLTAFAAIFLPLALITGIYGMNFNWIPELHWKYGYFYAISLLIVVGGILLFIFKRKKWF